MNAIDSLGLPCDGRLLALNSYENRVYQVGQDDGPPWSPSFIALSAGAAKLF
ncbi:hypothetical protein [Iodobacter fluviatilis]|uniref:hypothetical protein n=1 Tax=Iodobacter fluviatilis TaxID=537 RepID=UPI0021CDB8C2|nr:hypothetical protein [Iodobacter fluviatilis]